MHLHALRERAREDAKGSSRSERQKIARRTHEVEVKVERRDSATSGQRAIKDKLASSGARPRYTDMHLQLTLRYT